MTLAPWGAWAPEVLQKSLQETSKQNEAKNERDLNHHLNSVFYCFHIFVGYFWIFLDDFRI
jgi:hypothetical protein